MSTPTNSRLSLNQWGVRSTPSIPSAKATKSKTSRTDAGLSLKHVIGTTANSPNAIATLPNRSLLAFTAGAAAVICSFDDNLQSTQRFYRARPTAIPLNPIPSAYGPSTPTSSTTDYRARQSNRDSVAGPYTPTATDWSDSPGTKSWTTRERVKAATCVSFSPDGKYLAVGETGYKPRVLIFSTSKEASSDCPLTCLPDHTFGVRCVSFSPNSQYLASLGSPNDGFLYIWSINNRNGAATLYASNKCTSNISQIAWMGLSLVTVGTRHVKVWRPDGSTVTTPVTSPIKQLAPNFPSQSTNLYQRTLQGRNCLLGSLLEGTFTAVTPISSSQAFVCSETGDICLLDDSIGNQRFSSVTNTGFAILSASLNKDGNLVVSGKGTIVIYCTDHLLDPNTSPIPIYTITQPSIRESLFVSLAQIGKHVVAVDDSRIIRLIQTSPCHNPIQLQLPAHKGPVLGVRPLPSSDVLRATFYTWSTDGTILFWGADGICKRQFHVQLDQVENSDVNELKVVRTVPSAGLMVTGDKLGVLQILDEKTGDCIYSLRAHGGEITDIAVHNKKSLIASCGRDRTVQVYQRSGKFWELQQTLDEHVGAVTGLIFTHDAKNLISCSSDRTVVVREALTRTDLNGHALFAFMITRTITLKATPVSMCLLSGRNDVLFISTIDRYVQKYDLDRGNQLNSFKTADSEGGDAVVLSSLIHLTTINTSHVLAGVSSTDKSLRLYDENGAIIARDWGHTEGITDVTTTESSSKSNDDQVRRLITVAVDGTIFIWSYGTRSMHQQQDLSASMELMGITTTKDLLVHKQPIRRVLSQSEMARFRQSSPEQEDAHTPTTHVKRNLNRPPLEKKGSRFSLAQTPRLEPSSSSYDRRRSHIARSPSPSNKRISPPRAPSVAHGNIGNNSSSSNNSNNNRNNNGNGRKYSPPLHSPVIPQRKASSNDLNRSVNRQSVSTHSLRVSVGPQHNPNNITASGGAAQSPTSSDLISSTTSICRALRSYRRKLGASNEALRAECLREIEKELGLTARAVGEKAIKSKGIMEESVMVKILNQYSERLMEMVDEKFKAANITGGKQGGSSESLSEEGGRSSSSGGSGVEDEGIEVDGT